MMINDRMPEYTVERASKILNRYKKPLNGSKVLILGVAYKQDIDDYRESPALKVINILEEHDAVVTYYDPFVAKYTYKGESKESIKELSKEVLEDADLVMITTAHTTVDYSFVQRHAKAIFDTKNVMKNITKRNNIEVL